MLQPQGLDVLNVAGLLLGLQFGQRAGESMEAYRIRAQFQAPDFDACVSRLIAHKIQAQA